MKLVSLRLRRAPGLDKGLGDVAFTPGLNVVFGPNESGKSTLARAIQSTLWPDRRRPETLIDVETEWDHEGERWSARHDGATTWARQGSVCPAPSIPNAEYRTAYRLHLRDLIAGEGESDEVFARRIRSALDGGFDLSARVTPPRGPQHGRAEATALREARKARDVLEGERMRLAAQVEGLGALEAEKAEGERARAEDRWLERVERWHAARLALARAQESLAADATPELSGHELAELERLDGALEAVARGLEDVEGEIAAARDALEAAALPDEVPSDAQLDGWAAAARSLTEVARKTGDARHEVAGLSAAAVRLGALDPASEGAPLLAPSLERISGLASWLDRREQLQAERRVLESARRELLRFDASELAPPLERASVDALVQARGHVLAHARMGPAIAFTLAGAALGGSAAIATLWATRLELPPLDMLAIAGAAALATFAGAGLGLLIGRVRARSLLRRSLAASALDPAQLDVDPGDVAGLLDLFDEALRARRARLAADEESRRIDGALADLEQRSATLEATRAELVGWLDDDPARDDLTVVEAARRLADQRAAASALTTAKGELESLEAALARRTTTLVEALAPFARVASPPGALPTAESILAAVDHLRRRIASGAAASTAIAALERRRRAAHAERTTHDSERRALLERLRLSEHDAAGALVRLRTWTEALPERRRRAAAVNEAAAIVRGLESELASRPELLELDRDTVAQRRSLAAASFARLAEIDRELGRIEEKARAASADDLVEAASARVIAAEEALLERRREVIDDVAARLLLAEVSAEIDRDQRPEVLRRAAGFFERFTRHRYELRVEDGDEGGARFVARDHETGVSKQLGQLSDGTRMQLLLAARLAFVHEGEALVHPPLILDEALSSSDAERMASITDALVAEVKQGRQVFYMTNDPGDVRDWRAACERAGEAAPNVIELGAANVAAHAGLWQDAPQPAGGVSVPEPRGLTPTQYAARLGVAAPDPWSDVGELHLFHLLMDDLETLHRVLADAGVDRVGPFRAFARSGAFDRLFGESLRERIERRARLAERFLTAWRVGRGRRLRRGDLFGCEALSDAFKERLTSLADDPDVEGDGALLMARIIENKDERVKRFQRDKRQEFEAWLLAGGYLSEDAPLDEDALVQRVTAEIAEAVPRAGATSDADALRGALADARSLVKSWIELMHHARNHAGR